MAILGGGRGYLPGGKVPAPGMLLRTSCLRKPIRASCARPKRRRQSRQADRARPQDVVERLRRRGDRPLLPHPGADGPPAASATVAVPTADDMARFTPRVEAPATLQYGRYTVCKGGVLEPGSGASVQLAMSGLRSRRRRPAERRFHPHHRRVREARLCRPGETSSTATRIPAKVPGDVLLSDAYAEAWRKLIGQDASMDQRPGNIRVRHAAAHPRARRQTPRRARRRRARRSDASIGKLELRQASVDPTTTPSIRAARRSGSRRQARTHRHHARRHRAFRHHRSRPATSSSSTPSGGWLQSSPTIPQARLSASAAGAQQFGLEEGHPNAIGPGKRRGSRRRRRWRCSTANRTWPGARLVATQQDQWVLHMFLRHVHCGTNLQELINGAGLQFVEHFPSSPGGARRCQAAPAAEATAFSRRRSGNLAAAATRSRSGPALVWEGRLYRLLTPGQAAQGRCQSARHAGHAAGR